ncbi:MAG: pyridoxamine 5'-phosphate oxidase family protein [Acidimicrobiia bacterium]|nr:pyridoxamine 5'-phosphate oxidase family protein [Acidimicrobiia bacterium]
MSDRRDDVLAYLTSHNVATLATTGSDGPWASAVFYSSDGFVLEFLSSPRSRHAQNLATNARCAAAIHEDYRLWTEIRGVQIEGVVQALTGTRKSDAVARYEAKFPMVRSDQADAPIRAALERVEWYELIPDRCFFTDNTQGFGHRDEISIV